MVFDPEKHHRRSLRLKGYDYSQAGAYFVTVCTQDRACLFGNVTDGGMQLNDAGRIVNKVWHELPSRFPHIIVDAQVVMPNHFHGIILVGAQFIAPEQMPSEPIAPESRPSEPIAPESRPPEPIAPESTPPEFIAPESIAPESRPPEFIAPCQGAMNRAPTVGEMVRVFKAVSTRLIRQQENLAFGWQRNYYEHVIRSDESLNRIRQYILDNPTRWAMDRENPYTIEPEPEDAWRV